jgi:hypothetical protein
MMPSPLCLTSRPGLRAGRRRVRDAPEEGLHGREIDFDHVGGDIPMRLMVHAHRRFGIGRVDEAEAGAAGLVEPIGQEPHAIAVLHLEVLAVRLRDIYRRQPLEVVSIEKNRHECPPVSCSGLLLCRRTWQALSALAISQRDSVSSLGALC